MKLFVKFLKIIGIGAIFYPIGFIVSYFEAGGDVGKWFWLEILLVDFVSCIIIFLFTDFELVQKIKNIWQKNVIRIRYTKKRIQINASYMVTAQHKRALIHELSRCFDLKNSDDCPIKDDMLVNHIDEQDVDKYRTCFEEGRFKCSFDTFIEWSSFTLSGVKIYLKGSTICVATIDFEPNGDIHTVWIDVLDPKYMNKLRSAISRTRN